MNDGVRRNRGTRIEERTHNKEGNSRVREGKYETGDKEATVYTCLEERNASGATCDHIGHRHWRLLRWILERAEVKLHRAVYKTASRCKSARLDVHEYIGCHVTDV